MENNNYKLYRHTSPSGKVYIGITKNDINTRWKNGKGYMNQNYFFNAIIKYGWINFKHEVLFSNLSQERAEKLEIELIRHYRELGISYNIADGGKICNQSEAERLRSSLTMKKIWAEHPEKFKYNRTRAGQKTSIETIRKRSKPVVQYSLNNEFLKEYLSVPEASMATGIGMRSIRNCCKSKVYSRTRGKFINIHQAGGYIWKYKEDVIWENQ